MDKQIKSWLDCPEDILKSVTEPIMVQDREFRCVFANDLAAQLCGLESAEQFKNRTTQSIIEDFELFTEDGKPFLPENLTARRVLAGEDFAEAVYQTRHIKTGIVNWTRSRSRAIRGANGETQFAVTIFRDITEEKKSERNSQLFTLALQGSGIGLWEWSFIDKKIYLSDRCLEIFGLRSSDFGGHYSEFLDLIHPGDLTYVLHAISQVAQKQKVNPIEFRIIRQTDRSEVWVQAQGETHVTPKSQQAIRMVGTLIDISRQKNNEEIRRKMEQKVAKLQTISAYLSKAVTPLEIAQVVINEGLKAVEADAGSIYIKDETSQGLKHLYSLGYPVATLNKFSKITLKDSLPLVDAVRTARPVIIETQQSMIHRYPQVEDSVTGGIHHCWVSVPLIVQNNCFGVMGFSFTKTSLRTGQVDYMQSLADHVAQALDRARIYQEAQEERMKAHKANQAKSLFLANMSHEIRTPMNAILGFSKLLREKNLSEQDKEDFIRRIETNGDHLLHLIDDILDLSRVEAGQMKVETKSFSLKEMLWDVEESLKMLVVSKDIHVDMNIDPWVPDRIKSDPVRLKQVLMNLAGNAAKFTQAGYIRVTVESNYQNRILKFWIEDTGLGISDSVQSQLFKPFSQGDDSITRKFGGTGLGLVLSRRITEAIGGKLELVKSEKGKGTIFSVTVPWVDAESPVEFNRVTVSEPVLSPNKHKINVLLAEDVYDNQLLINLYLKNSEVKLTIASNGIEAVKKAKETQFDLILMDIQMPLMDGLEATRQIRASGYKGPILALTAHALPEEIRNSLAAGCNGHLTKPISKTILLSQIRSLTCEPSTL